MFAHHGCLGCYVKHNNDAQKDSKAFSDYEGFVEWGSKKLLSIKQ